MKSTKHKILLIDDTPLNLQVLTAALAADFELQIATSGPKGLALAESHRPDLILLDLNLPGVHGQEILVEIKTDPRLRHIPVIVLSSSSAKADVMDAYRAHANAYVAKPTQFSQFVALVARW